jgi:hypothetical protein
MILWRQTLAIIFLCSAGCGGSQCGKYANTNNHSHAVLPELGIIQVARGAELAQGCRVAGEEENLLYVLIVCPGLGGESTGSRRNVGLLTSVFTYLFSTTRGEISVSFTWDRQADMVHIAGVNYERANGNAFILRRDPATGHFSAQQLSNIDRQLNATEALRQMQAQLAADPVITSLRIYPGA